MINLLPTDLKQDYLYARRNTQLRHWALALLFGLVGVAIVTTAGLLYMQQSIDSYSHEVVSAQDALDVQNITEVSKHSQEITTSLKLVVQVLSREVLFSKLLTQIAAVTPADANLTDLSISKVEGAIDITASSTNFESATQLQVNLADPKNKIFSKADIQNITCSPNATNSHYPCVITLRALFSNNNPFLFINKATSTKARP